MIRPTRVKEAIKSLNHLQSNFQTLKEQEKHRLKYELPFDKYQRQKELIRKLDNGSVYDRLKSVPIIHVAGTKGKGSTCAFIESILRSKGMKTGFFSSPHLVSVTERIRINSTPIAQDRFAEYFWSVWSQLPPHERPAYFAFLSLVAFKSFIAENVDVIVLEVGIGGAFCATNVYPPYTVAGGVGRVSCVTALGYDHCAILGSTIEEIATNKCGIFHTFSQRLLVQRQQLKRAQQVVKQCAKDVGHRVTVTSAHDLPPDVKLGLSGTHQTENASLALAACRALIGREYQEGLGPNEARGLKWTKWPGRSQVCTHRGRTVYLDGAHTVESIDACVEWIASYYPSSLSIVFNITGKRDERPILELLAKLNPKFIFLTPNVASSQTSQSADQDNRNNPLSVQRERLHQIQNSAIELNLDVHVCDSVEDVFYHPDLTNDVLITGSIHLLGAFFQLRPELVQ